jgi:hypothetical protein
MNSRQRVMRGVFVGGALTVLGVSTVAAKPDEGQINGNAEGKSKVSVCHRPDATTGEGQVITVAAPATKGHVKHGDALCPADERKAYPANSNCTVSGVATFAFTQRTDAPCNSGAGRCDANGVCLPNQAPVE